MKKKSREMKKRKDPSDFLLPSFDVVLRPSHSSVSDPVRHPSLLITTHPFFFELAQSGLYFLEPQASN